MGSNFFCQLLLSRQIIIGDIRNIFFTIIQGVTVPEQTAPCRPQVQKASLS